MQVTHTHLTAQVSRYQTGKTNLDFTGARDSEWQWHQLGHMQVCTSLKTDNHASTSPLSFLQAGCPSCCPTNSVKALKELSLSYSTVGQKSKTLLVWKEVAQKRTDKSSLSHLTAMREVLQLTQL